MLLTILNAPASTAESNLSFRRARLRSEIGRILDYGRSETAWSTEQALDVQEVSESAVRMVLLPSGGHVWSWSRPNATLTLVSGTDTYTLPGDFGGMVGDSFTGVTDQCLIPRVIPASQLRRMKPLGASGRPRAVAIEPVAGTGSASPQRWQAIFYPTPDAAHVLSYRYRVLSSALTVGMDELPGGLPMMELYLQAARAACEQFRLDRPGDQMALFGQMMALAIVADQRTGEPDYYGYNGDATIGDETLRPFGGIPPIMLEGVLI